MSKSKRNKRAKKKSLRPPRSKIKNSAKNLKKRMWKHQGR